MGLTRQTQLPPEDIPCVPWDNFTQPATSPMATWIHPGKELLPARLLLSLYKTGPQNWLAGLYASQGSFDSEDTIEYSIPLPNVFD